jgi:hypothetical protein
MPNRERAWRLAHQANVLDTTWALCKFYACKYQREQLGEVFDNRLY